MVCRHIRGRIECFEINTDKFLRGFMKSAKIIGLGSYVPERVVTNHDLEKLMNTSDEWIQQRTGIQTRHWVTDQGNYDLGTIASQNAIENAGIKAEDIDCIIYCTLSPDHDFPGPGVFLGDKLGINGVPAYDIRQQCAGFVYGMQMADSLIKSEAYKTILLIGSEVHSVGLDQTPEGRDVGVLFGDGAGAMILQATDDTNTGIMATKVHADGKHAKELWLAVPGSSPEFGMDRINKDMIDKKLHFPAMNGKVVFTHAVRRMCEVLGNLCKEQQVMPNDIDLFVFHQANLRINEKVADMMEIDKSKVFNTIQKYANTTAATIPLTLDEARKEGVLKPGMLVASAAFGSGFVWGASLYRY